MKKHLIMLFAIVLPVTVISQDLTGNWLLQNEINYIVQKEYDTTFFRYQKLLLEKDINQTIDTMSVLHFDKLGVFDYCAVTERFKEPIDTVGNKLILHLEWEKECLSQFNLRTWEFDNEKKLLFIHLDDPNIDGIQKRQLRYSVEIINDTIIELTLVD